MSNIEFKISLVDNISKVLTNIRKTVGTVATEFVKTEKIIENTNNSIHSKLTASLLQFNNLNQSIQGITSVFNGVTDITARYSDALANVQKTTGLNAEQTKTLQSELENITTRTGVLELLNMSRVAGEFSLKSVKDISAFTQSVNMANVALGDQFGNSAETVARELGTIRNLFAVTKNMRYDEAMLRIGSSLNQLGNDLGTNAANLADFAKRMGQLGTLGTGLTETLGLGAALEKLGLKSEVASSGLSKVFLNSVKESKAFARHLGMTEEAFGKMIQRSPNEMLLKLLTSFKGLTNIQIAKKLDALKLGTDQESIKVFQALAANINLVTENQTLVNDAFKEGTSIKQEAALMEGTLAARLERSKKAIERITVMFGNYTAKYMPAIQATAMLTTTVSNLLPLLSGIGKIAHLASIKLWGFAKSTFTASIHTIQFASRMAFTATVMSGNFLAGILKTAFSTQFWTGVQLQASLVLGILKNRLTASTVVTNVYSASVLKSVFTLGFWKSAIQSASLGLHKLWLRITGFSFGGFIKGLAMSGWAAVKAAGKWIWAGITGMGTYITSLAAATIAQLGLNVAMNANPIGIIVLGLMALGAAVYAIVKNWDSIKIWLIKLKDFVIKMNPFYWLLKGIDTLFPGFMDTLKRWWDTIVGFFKGIIDLFKGIWNKYIAPILGFDTSMNVDVNENLKFDTIPSNNSNNSNDNTLINEGISGITGGGTRPTNITVNVNKLVERLELHSQNLSEGLNEVESKVIQTLLRVLNSANAMG
jgi:hypothetical protein